MSTVQTPLPVPISLQQDSSPRKRTSSFSYLTTGTAFLNPNPRPAKTQRISPAAPALTPQTTTTKPMGSALRRSETMVVIPDTTKPDSASYRVLQHYKDQRLRRKGPSRATAHVEPITSRPRLELTLPQPRTSASSTPLSSSPPAAASSSSSSTKPRKTTSAFSFTVPKSAAKPKPKAPTQIILPSRTSPTTTLLTHRTSSPLSPVRVPLPGRPVFPRSRAEPDLYRTALKMRMRSTPEGQRMLLMGPRVAMGIMTATAELERIIADQQRREDKDREGDIVMGDSTCAIGSVCPSPTSLAMPVLTASWVMVKGEDWEMVDCAA